MEDMTKYELIKDLPTFKKGEVFVLMSTGLHRYSDGLMAYAKETLDKFPNILKDWFKEVDDPNGRWEPKEGDWYYYVNYYDPGTSVDYVRWADDEYDRAALSIGNVYKTENEAEKAAEWLKARKVLFDDAKGFKPNWKDAQEPKWSVVWYWVGIHKGLVIDYDNSETYGPGPFFATVEDAEASIKAHEKEWKIYLGVEE